jgi:hypothetical protein
VFKKSLVFAVFMLPILSLFAVENQELNNENQKAQLDKMQKIRDNDKTIFLALQNLSSKEKSNFISTLLEVKKANEVLMNSTQQLFKVSKEIYEKKFTKAFRSDRINVIVEYISMNNPNSQINVKDASVILEESLISEFMRAAFNSLVALPEESDKVKTFDAIMKSPIIGNLFFPPESEQQSLQAN